MAGEPGISEEVNAVAINEAINVVISEAVSEAVNAVISACPEGANRSLIYLIDAMFANMTSK